MKEESRGSFQSRLGFILVSAGCAIGIGNVWKFPYVAGENGGAIFVLFYLLFLVLMGIPVMTMELAIGRASKETLVKGYKNLEPEKSKWHIHGWLSLAGCYLLMMYYTTVSGWMVNYFYKFATGRFENLGTSGVAEVFDAMQADPFQMAVFTSLTVLLGFGVLSFGVQNGLEKVNKVMMILLLLLIVILAVNSLTLEGAKEGVSFYLKPDLAKARKVGMIKVITAAMSQAFFTLSIGMGSIEIFGSYMSKDNALTGEAVRICALDTFVAIISGLIIFPACFSYGIQPDAGPSLIFVTLPDVFINMPFGRFWGTMFFLFMTFASFSTVTAVFENLVAALCDNFDFSRGKSIAINCVFLLIASLPCVFGFNILKNVVFMGNKDILNFEDYIVSNIILPAGSLIFLCFCVSKLGWGFDNYLKEVNTGTGMKLSPKLGWYLKFVLPILILIIFISGLGA